MAKGPPVSTEVRQIRTLLAALRKQVAETAEKITALDSEIQDGEQRVEFCRNNVRHMKKEAEIVSMEEFVQVRSNLDQNAEILEVLKADRASLVNRSANNHRTIKDLEDKILDIQAQAEKPEKLAPIYSLRKPNDDNR